MEKVELRAALNRLTAGTYTPEDVSRLQLALKTEQITIATGERNVAIRGDVTGSQIYTGDIIRIELSDDALDFLLSAQREPIPDSIDIDPDRCERLANAIYRRVRDERRSPLYEEAPKPQVVSRDELANYLLVRTAIERCVHRLYPKNQIVLKAVHSYLKWAAEHSQHSFSPKALSDHIKYGEPFYQTLSDLAQQHPRESPPPDGFLPDDPLIGHVVQRILERLVEKCNGRGGLLAIDPSSPDGSAEVLFRNLGWFDEIWSDKQEMYKRLFLKLCVRMSVWPDMTRPEAFLYPYNGGIARLLLNSGCLRVVPDRASLILADSDFVQKVAAAEGSVIELCYNWLTKATDKATQKFCQEAFRGMPYQVDRWVFSDYVDLWLYGQSRQYCIPRDRTQDGASLGCLLTTEPGGLCFCDADRLPWYRDGHLRLRR